MTATSHSMFYLVYYSNLQTITHEIKTNSIAELLCCTSNETLNKGDASLLDNVTQKRKKALRPECTLLASLPKVRTQENITIQINSKGKKKLSTSGVHYIVRGKFQGLRKEGQILWAINILEKDGMVMLGACPDFLGSLDGKTEGLVS